MSTQTTGLALASIGAALLWSAWAFVIAGVLLIVVPELAAIARRAAARQRYLAEVTAGRRPEAIT